MDKKRRLFEEDKRLFSNAEMIKLKKHKKNVDILLIEVTT